MKKFVVGQRVGAFMNENGEIIKTPKFNDDPTFGVVTEVLVSGNVRVHFDDDYFNELDNVFEADA